MEKTFVKMLETFKSYAKDSSHEIDSATADKWIELGIAEKADPVDSRFEQIEKAITDKVIDGIAKAVANKTDKVYAKPKDDSDKSFNDFLRLVSQNDKGMIEKKYGSKFSTIDKAPQSTQSGVLGGYLVPIEYSSEFLSVAPETSIVKPRAAVRSMSSNTLRVNALDQTVNMYGGVNLYYTEEGGEMTETNVKFRQLTLQARDLTGLCYVTNDELSDAAVDIAGIVSTQFRNAVAAFEDKQYLIGTGVNGPLGIYNSGAKLTATRNTTSHIKFEDIVAMESKMIENDNACWVVTKAAQGEVVYLKDGAGNPVYLQNGRDGGFPTLRGRPVFFTGKTGTALGAEGDIALVDFSYYYVGARQDIMISFSEHVKFTSNQMAYKIVYRHDGLNGLNAPIKLSDGSTSVSNVVLLAA